MNMLREKPQIDWKYIQYMLYEICYGGKVVNEWNRATLRSMV